MFDINNQYTTIELSTGHIKEGDVVALDEISKEEFSLVAKRNTGYFIKLHTQHDLNIRKEYSDELNFILTKAAQLGFKCVELDSDAGEERSLPIFEWS